MKDKSILILGVSSFVGSNLAEFFKRDYKVFGTYFRNKVSIPGVLTLPCDILKTDQLKTIFLAIKPDITLYCVGLSSIKGCHNEPNEALRLNANGLYFVIENCYKYNSKIIYISSALVFSGYKEQYGEIDIPDFTTELGKTKASGEYFIETSAPDYLILRCCQLYGRGIVGSRQNFFQEFQQHDVIGCDDKVLTGYLDIHYLGMVLSLALENNLRNLLLHVSSTNQLSRYEFAMLYSKIFRGHSGTFEKSAADIPYLSDKPKKNSSPIMFSLSTKNLENYLNITPPVIEESLEYTYRRFNGRNF